MSLFHNTVAGTSSTWQRDPGSGRWFVVATHIPAATLIQLGGQSIVPAQFTIAGAPIDTSQGIAESDFKKIIRAAIDDLIEVKFPLVAAGTPPIEIQ
jgi:hypothetical protein